MVYQERICTLIKRLAHLSIILVSSLQLTSAFQPQASSDISRRDAIGKVSKVATVPLALGTAFTPGSPAVANDDDSSTEIMDDNTKSRPKDPFLVYKVNPDASEALAPSIEAVEPQDFCQNISLCKDKIVSSSNGGVIWLGEHHNSKKDHDLQAQFIRSIYETRKENFVSNLNAISDDESKQSLPPISIGLEQVQVQYQSSLDDFVQGRISEQAMLDSVQWEKRWSWPYENYKPIFDVARELKIPLIALNVNSEDLAVVEATGFQGLSKEQVRRYIKDPKGFGEFAIPPAYKTYISYVIEPSYDLHQQMGILRTTITGQQLEQDMSFRNFFSGRILWDEAMAGNAFDWTIKNPGGLMFGLVGADHVKFEKGITGRYERLVKSSKNERESVSVLLNPTLIDTRPSGSVSNYANAASASYPDQITLQLRYLKDDVDASSSEMRRLPTSTGGVLSLADYLVISKNDV